jgi:nitrate reductase NapE component
MTMGTDASASTGAVHRYFEISLFLMLTVGFLALASTGQLDIFTLMVVTALPASSRAGTGAGRRHRADLVLFRFLSGGLLPAVGQLPGGHYPPGVVHWSGQAVLGPQ